MSRWVIPLEGRRLFVERQFALLSQLGTESVGAAAERLRSVLSAEYRGEIDTLEAALSGIDDPSTPDREEVASLSKAAQEGGGNAMAAFRSLTGLRRSAGDSIDGVLTGIGAQLHYLLLLILMLVVISMLYSIFVYPNLVDLYRDFGSEGQILTSLLFGRLPSIWLLVLLVTISVIGTWWFFRRLRLSWHHGAVLPQHLSSWPIAGTVVEARAEWHSRQWVLALTEAGVPLPTAIDSARRRFGGHVNDEELSSAAAIGTLREELVARCESQQERFIKQIIRARSIVLFGLRLSIYIVIAVVVIGMYGPIFKLGELT